MIQNLSPAFFLGVSLVAFQGLFYTFVFPKLLEDKCLYWVVLDLQSGLAGQQPFFKVALSRELPVELTEL